MGRTSSSDKSFFVKSPEGAIKWEGFKRFFGLGTMHRARGSAVEGP